MIRPRSLVAKQQAAAARAAGRGGYPAGGLPGRAWGAELGVPAMGAPKAATGVKKKRKKKAKGKRGGGGGKARSGAAVLSKSQSQSALVRDFIQQPPGAGDADFGERLQALRSALAGVGE